MTIRFQADADLNADIVTGLLRRERGIGFQTAEVAGLHGLADPVVLLRAAQEKRLLVSHERKTMPKHFAAFISTHTSSGLLIVPQRLSVQHAIEELLMIWVASEAEEWVNRIAHLPL